MPTGARLNLVDKGRIAQLLERLDPTERDSISAKVIGQSARLIEAEAKENQIVRGRGLTAPPLKKKLSYRTGHLSRSISTDLSGLPRQAIVGTAVRYSVVHELGISPYPRRPFLEPAAEIVVGRDVSKLFRRALERLRSI